MATENMYDRIMYKLVQRNDTAGHMCNSLGIRRALISDLKAGKNASLSAGNIALIANYLHVTCDYLILGKEPYASLPLDEIALLQAWRLASETERENVAFILRSHGFSYTSESASSDPSKEEKLA